MTLSLRIGVVMVLHCKRMKIRDDLFNLITFLLNLNTIDLKSKLGPFRTWFHRT